MAKTHSDLIRELDRSVAGLEERANGLRRDIDRVEKAHEAAGKVLGQNEARVAVLEDQAAESKRIREEDGRRRWTLVMAVVGSILALVANIILTLIRK